MCVLFFFNRMETKIFTLSLNNQRASFKNLPLQFHSLAAACPPQRLGKTSSRLPACNLSLKHAIRKICEASEALSSLSMP